MAAVSVLIFLTAALGQAIPLRFVCHPIQPGDTAALLAQRLTGNPENRLEPWFRILDPVAQRVISKSQYHLIRPGWLACVAVPPSEGQFTKADSEPAIDFVFVFWWAGFCLFITLIAWLAIERHIQKTQTMRDRMRLFGEMFIREFEQPLVSYGSSERPIRSRVRCMPHRRRLDILIAPDWGHHYPNLSDHKKNVEYDVDRIVQRLCQEPFVTGRLHTQGPWVVIPFEFKPITRTEGVL